MQSLSAGAVTLLATSSKTPECSPLERRLWFSKSTGATKRFPSIGPHYNCDATDQTEIARIERGETGITKGWTRWTGWTEWTWTDDADAVGRAKDRERVIAPRAKSLFEIGVGFFQIDFFDPGVAIADVVAFALEF